MNDVNINEITDPWEFLNRIVSDIQSNNNTVSVNTSETVEYDSSIENSNESTFSIDHNEYPNFVGIEDEISSLDSVSVPENSTIFVEESTSRFSGAIWYDEIHTKSIILAGLGGIGSYVSFLLSRMNPAAITMYDDDVVETANMSGQLYSAESLGLSKVTAMSDIMRKFSLYSCTYCLNERYTSDSIDGDIMICGFDNMEARRVFFNKWKDRVNSKATNEEKAKCLFIDGRLAAEEFQVFCLIGIDDFNIAKYETEWLFSDSEADPTVCSYKQTSYMANMIGSIMVNLFVNFCANLCNPIIPRDLPFMTSYDGSLMYFKTEV